jgi:hypothetical protein
MIPKYEGHSIEEGVFYKLQHFNFNLLIKLQRPISKLLQILYTSQVSCTHKRTTGDAIEPCTSRFRPLLGDRIHSKLSKHRAVDCELLFSVIPRQHRA